MSRAEGIVELTDCLPDTQHALGLIPSTQKVEAVGSVVESYPGLHSKFETSLGHVRLCLQVCVVGESIAMIPLSKYF